ncbi:MAG: hypothetical protein M3Z75_17455 [Actinomycetota bacterium]|nr:hypothetical protein [Actinomycetota bacterium]
MPVTAMAAEIILAENLQLYELESLSSRAGIFFARSRLEWMWEDPRWTDFVVAVRNAYGLAGLLPVSMSRLAGWPDRLYDVSEVTGVAGYAAPVTCLLGGRADACGSMLFGRALTGEGRHLAADCAVGMLMELARERRLRCAGLYISAREAELSAALRRARMRAHPAPARSFIRWPEPTTESYLDHLTGSHRAIVRRDWRKRDALGLRCVPGAWHELSDEAAPAIASILVKHGYQSHPRLVRMRLRRWGAVAGDHGFALRAETAGTAAGYAFGWHDQNVTTMYEVGIAQDRSPLSQAAYLELLVYGPVAAACARGISALDLGMFAAEPKRLRGAIAQPIFHWTMPAE